MLEPMEPVNLTDEQKTWRVVELVQRERFTMLEPKEPKEPNNLTPEKTGWPVIEIEEVASEVNQSDLATIRGLIDRLGADRLQQIVGTLAAGGTDKAR